MAKAQFNIRLDTQLADQLRQDARIARKSLSAYVQDIIEAHYGQAPVDVEALERRVSALERLVEGHS